MAKRVIQAKLWKSIAIMIEDEFDNKVYSDEVREEFETPCFFIKSLMHSQLQNKFYIKRNQSIICTYFPDEEDKNEDHYMEMTDRFLLLFQRGINVEDRHFDVTDIHGDRIGEDEDIMQFTMEITYMDTTGILEEKTENGESMDTVQIRYEVEFEEGRKWQN
ncbi:DUF6838 family protein [Veillonella sp. VA142]|uniref:phage tail terminator family protein n=1 Tax=Veillonella sp. VA142 TaxID=741834 RepID=UPI000F8E217A|nr:hypothetical protein [Veillonella sp. VA142]